MITDPCHESCQDWSFGTMCIKTAILENISETIDVLIGQNSFKVRVKEIDGKLFDQSPTITKDEDEEEDGEFDDEDPFMSSDEDESENISDEEYDEAYSESVVQETVHDDAFNAEGTRDPETAHVGENIEVNDDVISQDLVNPTTTAEFLPKKKTAHTQVGPIRLARRRSPE